VHRQRGEVLRLQAVRQAQADLLVYAEAGNRFAAAGLVEAKNKGSPPGRRHFKLRASRQKGVRLEAVGEDALAGSDTMLCTFRLRACAWAAAQVVP
jgi:hypothetical protein